MRPTTFFGVGVGLGVALAGPVSHSALLAAWFVRLFFGLGYGARGPIIGAIAADLFAGRQFGTIFGIMSIGHGIGEHWGCGSGEWSTTILGTTDWHLSSPWWPYTAPWPASGWLRVDWPLPGTRRQPLSTASECCARLLRKASSPRRVAGWFPDLPGAYATYGTRGVFTVAVLRGCCRPGAPSAAPTAVPYHAWGG
jgi:MFS family permease